MIKKFLLEGAKYKAEELCGQYYDKDICAIVFILEKYSIPAGPKIKPSHTKFSNKITIIYFSKGES